MITYYFRTLKDAGLKLIEKPRPGSWTHVVDPNDEEIAQLSQEFGLDATILADARDFFEVPRMEKSGAASYFFTRYPYDDDEEYVDTAPILIVTGESFVITIALREVPQFEAFLSDKVVVHTTQKAKFFIQIMRELTISYERALMRIRKSVHRDQSRLRRIGNREIVRLVDVEHELNDMVDALIPTNTWLNQVTKGNYMQLYTDDVALMEDLMIANSQLVDSARSVLKTIQNIRTASEAILTNNLNATIRTLTVLTILLTVPTIIASLYGMNIPLPLADSPYAFWFVLVTIVTIVSVLVVVFKRNRWL